MVLDPILAGVVDDAYIVPVSIYYDGVSQMHLKPVCFVHVCLCSSRPAQVMETESYVRELSGSQKRKDGSCASAQQFICFPFSSFEEEQFV